MLRASLEGRTTHRSPTAVPRSRFDGLRETALPRAPQLRTMPCIVRRHPAVILLLFFASGFCGLVYEVVWLRHLSLVFGNTVYATATVLSGFMGGLALGSLWLGRVADRTGRPLRLYGLLEAGVALCALAFPVVLHSLEPLYRLFARVTQTSYHCLSFAQSLLLIGIILVPTVLMGGTLPLLTRYLSQQRLSLGRNVSLLYGLNTLGAVLGCAAAGFVLIGWLGVQRTTFLAVALNVAIAAAAILMDRAMHPPVDGTPIKPQELQSVRGSSEGSNTRPGCPDDGLAPVRDGGRAGPRVPTSPGGSLRQLPAAPAAAGPAAGWPGWLRRVVLGLFVIAGLAAMAYEVLWTRVLSFVAGSTTYSFTLMLTTYLCGLAVGSVLAAPFVDRTRRPLETFGVLQLLTGVGVLATVALTPNVLAAVGAFLFDGGRLRHGDLASFAVLQGTVAVVYILPFTILMGMTFPVVARIYTTSRERAGTGVGWTYFADTIGGVAGSLLAGFALIPWLGTLRALAWIAIANTAIGVTALLLAPRSAGLSPRGWPRGLLGVAAVAVLGLAVHHNLPADTFAAIFTAPGSKLVYLDEDVGGTVTIEDYGDHRTISINGINVAGTDLKFETTQKLQAHLALLLHPEPQRVLQIGFGSGGTAWSLTRHPLRQIDCVELTAAVLKARDQFREVNHGVLDDPRVRVFLDDARSYLVKTDRTYDAILSDSIHPRYAGNGGLYAVDYYRLCRRRLTPTGIFSAWLPIYGLSLDDFRVAVRSLREVFPHVYLFHLPVGRTDWAILLGLQQPLRFDLPDLSRRFAEPSLRDDLRVIHLRRVEDLLSGFLIGDQSLPIFLGSSRVLNTDDYPYLEYVAPRSGIVHSREALLVPLYTELFRMREPLLPYLQPPGQNTATIETAYASSAHVLQARLLEVQDPPRPEDARRELIRALQLDPLNPVARNLLGLRQAGAADAQ